MEESKSKGLKLFFGIFILIVIIGIVLFIWTKKRNSNFVKVEQFKAVDLNVIDTENKYVNTDSGLGESKGPLK